MRVVDLLSLVDERSPLGGAAAWDPVGLQLGHPQRDLASVAVCHEITDAVVDRAIQDSISALVTYHPLLFTPSTALIGGGGAQGRALTLIESGIAVIVVHTAFDVASGGTGDALLDALGLTPVGEFSDPDDPGSVPIGRFGVLSQPVDRRTFAASVSTALAVDLRSTNRDGTVVDVAVVPGSGGSFVAAAAEVADTLVTGDVSHHRAREAVELGLFVIDAGHAATERPGVRALYSAILDVVPDAILIDVDPTPWEGCIGTAEEPG
jgi:dinuclear metal center YbgI/SA1388 family protein